MVSSFRGSWRAVAARVLGAARGILPCSLQHRAHRGRSQTVHPYPDRHTQALAGAVCDMCSARTDLCGWRAVRLVLTATSGLPLAVVARDHATVIEMRMLLRIELHHTAAIQLETQPPSLADSLDGRQFAVGQLQVRHRRGELHAVSHGKASLLLTIDRDALLPASTVVDLRAILPHNGEPVVRLCSTSARTTSAYLPLPVSLEPRL